MPFNGTGGFTRVMDWTNDAAALIKIRADRHDQEDDNFAAGLSNTICKDGQTTITADIPFNSKKITNLANPVGPQDAATKAYADAIRVFSSSITLTMGGSGEGVKFSNQGTLGMSWTHANHDLFFGSRPAGTPAGSIPRWVWNDKADGTGNDRMTLTDAGTLTLGAGLSVTAAGDMRIPANSTQPVGTVIRRTYTTSPATWTRPNGLKGLKVVGQGPGGGSGGLTNPGAGTYMGCGGAGAGSYGEKVFFDAELTAVPASVAITIGAGGAAGTTAGTGGGTGGTSSFGSLCTFPGGDGSTRSTAVTTVTRVDGGTQSGVPTGCDLALAGGPGDCCVLMWNSGLNERGTGGKGMLGLPFAQNVLVGGVGALAGGYLGSGYGNGSAGANTVGSQAARAGAVGGDSIIIVEEYF